MNEVLRNKPTNIATVMSHSRAAHATRVGLFKAVSLSQSINDITVVLGFLYSDQQNLAVVFTVSGYHGKQQLWHRVMVIEDDSILYRYKGSYMCDIYEGHPSFIVFFERDSEEPISATKVLKIDVSLLVDKNVGDELLDRKGGPRWRTFQGPKEMIWNAIGEETEPVAEIYRFVLEDKPASIINIPVSQYATYGVIDVDLERVVLSPINTEIHMSVFESKHKYALTKFICGVKLKINSPDSVTGVLTRREGLDISIFSIPISYLNKGVEDMHLEIEGIWYCGLDWIPNPIVQLSVSNVSSPLHSSESEKTAVWEISGPWVFHFTVPPTATQP